MLKCQEADRGCLLKYTLRGLFVDIDPNNQAVSELLLFPGYECIVGLWSHEIFIPPSVGALLISGCFHTNLFSVSCIAEAIT